MKTVNDYLPLITTEHKGKPKFEATVKVAVAPACVIQNELAKFLPAFDIDTAIGRQLDTLGIWIGRARRISTPLTGIYFTWDETADTGWDSGVWKGPYDPDSGLVDLPDDSYRLLLRAKIAANSWDGSIPNAYAVWESVFPGSSISIQDNQDMSMSIGISNQILSAVDRELLVNGYIPLKPQGVRVNYYAVLPTEGKIFAWDVEESDAFSWWDSGLWATELTVN